MRQVWLTRSECVVMSTLNGRNALNRTAFRCMLMVALMNSSLLFANTALPADSGLNAELTCSIEKNLLAAGQGSTKKIARRNALFKLNSKWQNMMPNAPAIEMDDDRLSFSCSKKLIWSCLATLTTPTPPTTSTALQNCQQSAKLSVKSTALTDQSTH